jgi:hypothetical protein
VPPRIPPRFSFNTDSTSIHVELLVIVDPSQN